MTTPVWPDARGGVVLLRPARAPSAPPPSAARRRPTRCWRAADEDAFVAALLERWAASRRTSCGCGEINRRGPASWTPARRCPADRRRRSRALQDGGGQVIDVRPVADFAAGHIRGVAVHPAAAGVRDLAGLARPRPDRPLVIVARPRPGPRRDRSGRREDRLRQPRRELSGGMPAWDAAGHPVAARPAAHPRRSPRPAGCSTSGRPRVRRGHLPGAPHIELGDARRHGRPDLPPGPWW